MSAAFGVLLGMGLATVILAAHIAVRTRRSAAPEAAAMQVALHAATATLPYLRHGLTRTTAELAVPHLRALTGAAAIALADSRAVLAIDGDGGKQVRPGDLLTRLLDRTRDDHMKIVPHLISSDSACSLHSAVLVPLLVQRKRTGTLITFYRSTGRPSEAELRVVQEAANLVCAQVELSVVEKQDARVARAELHALRAQISSHFIYNALAAVAGHIHANPAEARELLTDFAEFTRHLLRDRRSYVTLGEELEHVRRYLRLEKARLRGRLHVIADVEPAALSVIVPTLSIQPLVENAVQHGVECRVGTGRVEITAKIIASDMQLQVSDKGNGIEADRIPEVLAGTGGGVGLANVNARLRATFGERYALRIKSTPGEGTTAVITVPRLHAQARAAARMTGAGGVARRHQGQTPAPRPEKPAADFARDPPRPRGLGSGK